MYIAHYKSVVSKKEFFSKPKNFLDFSTQVTHNKERYMLFATHVAATPNQQENMRDTAKKWGIEFDVEVD